MIWLPRKSLCDSAPFQSKGYVFIGFHVFCSTKLTTMSSMTFCGGLGQDPRKTDPETSFTFFNMATWGVSLIFDYLCEGGHVICSVWSICLLARFLQNVWTDSPVCFFNQRQGLVHGSGLRIILFLRIPLRDRAKPDILSHILTNT